MNTGEDFVMSWDEKKTQRHLFNLCIKGKWEEVVETYKKDKKAHTARITRSGDTALHVAITDGQDDIVQQLVEVIPSDERKEALGIQNERGDTALHFAASMGNVQMCYCIASADSSLLSIRNVDGETPLFLAALHGRKEAFLCLHYLSFTDPNTPVHYSICRRNNGDTILHSAIAGDYLDLAFTIIHLYEDIVNWVNERGYSPLHLLASKASNFRSVSHLGRFETIIYEGIFVKQLEVEPKFQQLGPNTGIENSYPENYETCMNILKVIKNSASVVTNKFPGTRFLINKVLPNNQTQSQTVDLESSKTKGAKTKSSGSEARDFSHPLFPVNYKCCVDLFKFVLVVISVIFGRGSRSRIQNIRQKKEKHLWSVQIMNELLNRASTYDYDDYSGNSPNSPNLKDKTQETTPYGFPEVDDHTLVSITKVQQQKKDKHVNLEEKKLAETPLLIAAKNGVIEMVEKILELFPVAIHDMDAKKKNIVLLAVENRQPHLYEMLLKKKKIVKESVFKKVDNEGNSALHLAARFGDYKPWLIPGAALQMQLETRWYLFIEESMA